MSLLNYQRHSECEENEEKKKFSLVTLITCIHWNPYRGVVIVCDHKLVVAMEK